MSSARFDGDNIFVLHLVNQAVLVVNPARLAVLVLELFWLADTFSHAVAVNVV